MHAHPDDETLTSGVLLSTAVAVGLPATVITCTRGERGEVIGTAHRTLEGDGPGLAAHRESEIAAAMRALGGVEQHFLDALPGPAARYVDSGMAWLDGARAGAAADLPADALVGADLDEAAGRLAALLRTERPRLVVTYEPGGGYGHPDHVRTHVIVRRAVELLGARSPALAVAITDAGRWRAGMRALTGSPTVRDLIARHADPALVATRQGPFTVPDPDGALPVMAREHPSSGFAVATAPVRNQVLAALSAHATQVQAVTALDEPDVLGCYALSNGALAPVLPEERYEWMTPGGVPDGLDDLLIQLNAVA